MNSLTCQKCGLINPPSAENCDCGYSFHGKVSLGQKKIALDHAPGMWIRIQSLFLDGLIFFLPIRLIELYFHLDLAIYDSVAFVLYEVFTLTFYGQTLGCRFSHLILLDMAKEKVSFPRVLTRSCFDIVAAILPIVGYVFNPKSDAATLQKYFPLILSGLWCPLQLIAFYSSEHRRWIQDYIAGTRFYHLK